MKLAIFTLILFTYNSVMCQEFLGIATYRSSQQVSVKMDSTQVSSAQAKEINAMLNSQFDNEFKLQFNKTESLYKMEEKLKLDAPQTSGARVMVMGHTGQSPLYKNTAAAQYVKEEDLMGKRFLVKDELPKPDWKLEPEQKKIGNYTVYKATWTRDVDVANFDKDKGLIKTSAPKTTIAWYTPEIPVSHGPRDYWGLPGLIMEIQEDKFSLLCTAIVLNPKDKFSIEVPTKGKQIDQASFNKIRDEKTKEMMEQFGKGREDGVRIKIGN